MRSLVVVEARLPSAPFAVICRRLEMNSSPWRRGIFDRISTHPMDRLEELLPDNVKAAETATQNIPPDSPVPEIHATPDLSPPGDHLSFRKNLGILHLLW